MAGEDEQGSREGLSRIRAGVERWPAGNAREIALRALDDLIAEAEDDDGA